MKYSAIRICYLFFFVVGVSVSCLAQKMIPVTDSGIFYDKMKQYEDKWTTAFENKWIGKQFPLIQDLRNIPNYNESLLKAKATVVYMGFSGCHPCEHQLPFLFKFIKEQPNILFVYLTFNSLEIFQEELKSLNLNIDSMPNFYFVSMEEEKIRSSGLAGFGYPVIYFLNSAGVINSVKTGGSMNEGKDYFKYIWLRKLSFTP